MGPTHPPDASGGNSAERVVIVFDIETTGLKQHSDRIIEIAAMNAEDSSLSMVTLVNPGRIKLPKKITEITGIQPGDLASSKIPAFPEAARRFEEFIEAQRSKFKSNPEVVLVAHNGRRFDVPFLEEEYKRANRVMPDYWQFLDSLPLARRAWPTKQGYGLGSLCEFLQVEVEGELHRALADVQALRRVYLASMERLTESNPLERDTFTITSPKKNDSPPPPTYEGQFPTRYSESGRPEEAEARGPGRPPFVNDVEELVVDGESLQEDDAASAKPTPRTPAPFIWAAPDPIAAWEAADSNTTRGAAGPLDPLPSGAHLELVAGEGINDTQGVYDLPVEDIPGLTSQKGLRGATCQSAMLWRTGYAFTVTAGSRGKNALKKDGVDTLRKLLLGNFPKEYKEYSPWGSVELQPGTHFVTKGYVSKAYGVGGRGNALTMLRIDVGASSPEGPLYPHSQQAQLELKKYAFVIGAARKEASKYMGQYVTVYGCLKKLADAGAP
eukprot:gene12733-15057_t